MDAMKRLRLGFFVLPIFAAWSNLALALTCAYPGNEEILMSSNLIFWGKIVDAGSCQNNSAKIRYRIEVLYKGWVPERTIEVQVGSSLEGCSTPELGQSGLVLLKYLRQQNGVEGFHEPACMGNPVRTDVMDFLPDLDRYRSSLQEAYRKVDSHPQSVANWQRVLTLQQSFSDYLGARHSLIQLRRLAPREQLYAILFGDNERALGRLAEAEAAFSQALQLGSDNDLLRRARAQLLVLSGKVGSIDPAFKDFSNMNIEGFDFSNRQLDRANFERTTLYSCRLVSLNLDGTNFSRAYLNMSDFTNSSFKNANLHRVQSNKLVMTGSNFDDANLSAADLSGAQLANASLDRADLTDASLEQANLSKVDLRTARLLRTRLIDAQLNEANLNGVNLSYGQLQGADLRGAQLVGAVLRGAYLSGLPLEIRSENEEGRMKPADIRGADLTGAVLAGADLRDVRYDCTTKFPAGFKPVKLQYVESAECPAINTN